MGMGVELLGKESREVELLNLKGALVSGRLPQKPWDLLISDLLAQRLKVQPGETVTIIGSTMNGSITMYNFNIAGTVKFGINALDRSAIIAELSDIQTVLNMPDGAGEILGFSPDTIFDPRETEKIKSRFNAFYQDRNGEFIPVMKKLTDEPGMMDMFNLTAVIIWYIVGFFVFIMSIVLWNTGLMGSIRRYGEMGLRLAMGEEKKRVYRSLLIESVAIGLIGCVIGTALGLALAYYLQIVGIDISDMMGDSTVLMSNVMRARVTPVSYVIGLLPGLVAPLLGSAISGLGIYKRQTSQLFKELEV